MVLDAQPHASAVLDAALRATPSHAYLLHGPAGSGKRDAARAFAAELLSRGARDPDNARGRVTSGAHPDLTWVAPSGAHEMLRRDVGEAVVSAATRTPFEAAHRVFVLERVDTMNDEAANSLLKTLEEPPGYVVLLLLTNRLTQVLATIASRCQPVRFDAPSAEQIAARLEAEGVPAAQARAAARLSLGDGERARSLVMGEGPKLRADAEAFARGGPAEALLKDARALGRKEEERLAQALLAELEYLPKKEHRRRQTEFAERAKRAARRAETEALDHALQLVGLFYRDLAALAAGAPELVHHVDRLDDLSAQRGAATYLRALDLAEDTRARLPFNVSPDLAFEALAYRLAELAVTDEPATGRRAG